MCNILVLTRKKNEVIIIGDDVRITVVDIRGDKVRIGIEAPRDVDVHREEVYKEIHARRNSEDGGPGLDGGPDRYSPDSDL